MKGPASSRGNRLDGGALAKGWFHETTVLEMFSI